MPAKLFLWSLMLLFVLTVPAASAYAEGTKYIDIPKSDFLAWDLPDHFWK